jgi:outer membrane protein assembly factor BamE (lipoprotein component of BamABCDE complex)
MPFRTQQKYRRFLAGACLLVLTACQPTIDYRGYQARPGDMDRVQVGMPKSEVEATLGSPSTTASINYQGDSYYYISSRMEQRAFFTPEETDRQVYAIRFDQNDQVASFANYGLEDGQVVDFSSRKTPTVGKELTILQQIFSNVGRFKGGKTTPAPSPIPKI